MLLRSGHWSSWDAKLEAAWATTASMVLTVILALIWAWKVLNWSWVRPKRLERLLKQQDLQGTLYRLLFGDFKDMQKMQNDAKSKPMNLFDDIVHRVLLFPPNCQQIWQEFFYLVWTNTAISSDYQRYQANQRCI